MEKENHLRDSISSEPRWSYLLLPTFFCFCDYTLLTLGIYCTASTNVVHFHHLVSISHRDPFCCSYQASFSWGHYCLNNDCNGNDISVRGTTTVQYFHVSQLNTSAKPGVIKIKWLDILTTVPSYMQPVSQLPLIYSQTLTWMTKLPNMWNSSEN